MEDPDAKLPESFASMIFLTFLMAFALYLYTSGPSLVPYRDAGEMATSVPLLGILHPTSYPFYSVSGHLASLLPLGNPAYRLNVYSALAMAAAWAILFSLLNRRWGKWAAVLTIAMGAVSYHFWIHAVVSEMYALNVLFLAGILFLLDREQWYLAALVFGLGLGNRSDLVLCLPAFLVFGIRRKSAISFPLILILALLGFSIYLYLPLRAAQHPWLNWNNPSTLNAFIRSLLRLSYGGTLDLLSQSYAMGENFLSEFMLYGRHLLVDFAYIGIPLALAGLWSLWRKERSWAWVVLVGWGVTGPLFIFLGNLPPNPHAVAIMEAAYLVPDIFFLIAVAAGVGLLAKKTSLGCFALLVCIAWSAYHTFPQASRRYNFIACDFIRNMYHTLPSSSALAARSDVPIFSLFYGHWIYPRLPNRYPVAQGLSGSEWYQASMREQEPALQWMPVHSRSDWMAFQSANPLWSIFGTQDTDWSSDLFPDLSGYGALVHIRPSPLPSVVPTAEEFLRNLYVYRGVYRYDAYREFFSPELIEEYAKAWANAAEKAQREHRLSEADDDFHQALRMKPDMPYPAFEMAFDAYAAGNYAAADHAYAWAVHNFQIMQQETEDWKSFPDMKAQVVKDEAQAMSHWGVVQEHLHHLDRAQSLYEQALAIDPQSADAHYNIAVLAWQRQDWKTVVDHLHAMAQAHPEDSRWKAYLPVALAHLQKQ